MGKIKKSDITIFTVSENNLVWKANTILGMECINGLFADAYMEKNSNTLTSPSMGVEASTHMEVAASLWHGHRAVRIDRCLV